jgi:threonine/homoserine/homoserine lactone efflux protein
MDNVDVLGSYLTAVAVLALLAVVPGPDVAVVTRFALTSGRPAAVRAALGVVLGLLVWGVLTVLGLAAVLASSAQAYTVVKLVGAAYLVLMGVRTLWRSRMSSGVSGDGPGPARGRPLRVGLLTNLLNPKIAVFYTSVLPSLVPHGASPVIWLAVLVATHVALSLGWLTGYAVVFSRSRSLLGGPRVRRCLDWMTGVVLIGFGLRLAAETR